MERSLHVSGPDLDHSIYRYTDQIYKIVQWKISRVSSLCERSPSQHYDRKLEPSLSRTKSEVLELALCNDWDFFCTFTIDEKKFDRFDLCVWQKSFTQWLRDQRKKGLNIAYLLVPERHKDGAWHCHGLFRGLDASHLVTFSDLDSSGFRLPSGRRLPKYLRESDYCTWMAYYEKFGYNSFGLIRSSVASAFYVSKYITKDNLRSVTDLHAHKYWASQKLNRKVKHLDFFGRSAFIDSLVHNDFDFCRVGFTKVSDNLDWSFALEHLDLSELDFHDPLQDVSCSFEAERFFDFDQMSFWR